jgi:hypothetical protein
MKKDDVRSMLSDVLGDGAASITQDRAERRRAVCHLCHGSGKRLSDTSSHHRDGKTCWSFTYDACTCLAGLVRGGVR